MSYIVSSGITSDGIILENDSMTILDGGIANSTTVKTDGRVDVSSGGTANDTVKSGGALYVYNGGTANGTVNSNGTIYVYSGGTASDTTVIIGSFTIASGGTAIDTVVSSGRLFVTYGTASGVTVEFGGRIDVNAAGTATEIRENGGYVYTYSLNNVTFVPNSFSGFVLSESNATVHSGTTANSITVNKDKLSLEVFSGGTANDTIVNAGSLCIASGGIANRITVSCLNPTHTGTVSVGSGGIANDAIVTFGGIEVSSDGTVNGADLVSMGYLRVSGGGTANSTTVGIYSIITVISGGTATEVRENGGFANIDSNATVTFASNTFSGLVLAGTTATVHSGTTANSNMVVSVGGYILVYSGGIANDTIVTSQGNLRVSSGGTANNTILESRGILRLSSGATANNTTLESGCSLTVGAGISVNGITVNSGGRLIVNDEECVTGMIENGGFVSVASGMNPSFASNSFSGLVLSNAAATVHSGTTATDTTVDRYGGLFVFSGGTANGTTVNSGGTFTISSGGTANEVVENGGFVSVGKDAHVIFAANSISGLVLSGGSTTIHSGTTANGTTVDSAGRLIVFSGGTANSTTVSSGGSIFVSSGGTATDIIASKGASLHFTVAPDTWIQGSKGGIEFEIKDAVLSGFTIDHDSIVVSSGGAANGTTVKDGMIEICSGGTATDTTADYLGIICVSSGGTADSTTVNIDCTLSVGRGGTATEIKENGGLVIVDSGATVTFASHTLTGLVLSGGSTARCSTTVHSGTTANSTTIISRGDLLVYSGGIANDTTVFSGGRLHISSGGTATGTIINSYGFVAISSGGTANSTTINSGGSMSVVVGGVANGITVNYRASVFISSGATATAIRENGGYVQIDTLNSNVTFVSNVLSNYMLENNAALHSGTTAVNVAFSDLTIFDGGVAEDARATRGRLSISSGGTANNTVMSGGTLFISSRGVANGTVINVYMPRDAQRIVNASMFVSSGGTANNTVLKGINNTYLPYLSGGVMDLQRGATANNTSVGSGGILNISGVANNVVVDGFQFVIGDDQIQSGIVNIVGGSASHVTVNIGGQLNMNSGKVTDVVENGGYVKDNGKSINYASNTFSGLSFSRGLSATVHSGTTAADISVLNSGLLHLFSGGKLTGKITCLGGSISAASGAIVNFDLARTTPGAAPLFNKFSSITGSPTYTLTVNAGQAEGLYTLAAGVTKDVSLTVVNTAGETLGQLVLDETASISGVDYTLTLSDQTLSLRVGTGDTPLPCTSSGTVVSSGSAAVNAGETFREIHVYSGGTLHISSGGTADLITIHQSGKLIVSKGASAVNVMEEGGTVVSQTGAKVSFAPHVFSNTYFSEIHSGTTVFNAKVAGSVFVYEGAMVDGVEVIEPGRGPTDSFTMNVSGGTVCRAELINPMCMMYVYSGGVASDTVLTCKYNTAAGRLFVSSGGTAVDTVVSSLASMNVAVGGTAVRTRVDANGSLFISSGGSALEIVENGGFVSVGSKLDSRVTFASNTFTGVSINGSATIHSGTTAFETTLLTGAFLTVFSGGIANGTLISSQGIMNVNSGATVDGVTVSSGGRLFVSNGGTLTGRMSFERSASVMANGTLDFDLTQTNAGVAALLNDLSIVQGSPKYTLTVDGKQAEGVYTLAAGAARFTGTITVKNTYGADLGTLRLGEKVYIGKDDYTLTLTDDVLTVAINSPTVTNENGDVLLENTLPKARYMYGCVNTSIAMMLGYYDLYGYLGKDFSALIEGDVELDSRGTGYDIYMMDDFESNLGKANASRDYVERFFSKDSIEAINARTNTETTPAEELPYSFVDDGAGTEIRTDVWNCIADYLGTGQFWRGNDNLHATSDLDMLEVIMNDNVPFTVTDEATGIQRTIEHKYTSCLYGLYLYVRDKGFDLDRKTTKIYHTDTAGGEFTFDDYRKEIDAGRPVMVLVTGHAMVGYGYNAETREIIFDNCLQSGERMVWDGTYNYAVERPLEAICTFGIMTADTDIDLAVVPFDKESKTNEKLIVATAEGQLESADYCFEGSTLYLSLAMSNLGTTPSGVFDVMTYCDLIEKELIPSLTVDPGETRRVYDVQLVADFGAGLHSIGVWIDPDNLIPEMSGLNNSGKYSLMVLKEGTNVVEGTQTVASGEVSTDDYVMNGAVLDVLEGGTAEATLIQGKVTSRSLDGKDVRTTPGLVNVYGGGLIRNADVYEYGRLDLLGTAENIRVRNEGKVRVTDGGVVSGAHVDNSGFLGFTLGGKLTGKLTFEAGALVYAYEGAILDFDLTRTEAGADALVNDWSIIRGVPACTLTVNAEQADGVYALAAGAADFGGTISVVNTTGDKLGVLTLGRTVNIGDSGYTLNLNDDVLSVTVGEAVAVIPARGDRDGNGISDVMFVWTGNNYAHGYWMNGTSEWWSANSTGVSSDWDNLGSYDMSGDGKADAVMFGNVVVNEAKGAYIGYYQDGDDANGWVNIGFLDNSQDIAWKNTVGNLTGGTANSIVWYAPELYALGAWTDGTDSWVTLSNTFGGDDWTLVGCGDFDGDGRDSVLMTYNNGQIFYTADLDGATASLGSLNWSGWEVRAIGDFAGDGRDDIVIFHPETGSLVMFKDGNADIYASMGQLDANDWFVAGAGDYNNDGRDELLVRQYSTGMLGYYSDKDGTTRWNVLGYGVDMSWTVIA